MRKNWIIGDLFGFQRVYIYVACLGGVSVTKAATLFGVSRATVSNVMSAYMNRGKTTSARKGTGRK
jgi:transposase